MSEIIICGYCDTQNNSDVSLCISCGFSINDEDYEIVRYCPDPNNLGKLLVLDYSMAGEEYYQLVRKLFEEAKAE